MNVFPTKILLATDGSDEAQRALETVVELVKTTGSELHVVHIGPLLGHLGGAFIARGPLPAPQEEFDREARRLLDAQVKKIEAAGGGLAQAHLVVSERPDAEIVSVAEEVSAGLVAMGSRGLGGIRRALMGSVSDSVVRHAPCPVLVVRQIEEYQTNVFPTKILLASDGSKDAELALDMAVGLADSTGSELHLVAVGNTEATRYTTRGNPALLEETVRAFKREAQEILDDQAKKIEEAGGSVRQQHLRMGNAAKEIVVQADEIGAGLIAMGSRGLGRIRRALMGSVSDSVVRHASCPVLVARSE